MLIDSFLFQYSCFSWVFKLSMDTPIKDMLLWTVSVLIIFLKWENVQFSLQRLAQAQPTHPTQLNPKAPFLTAILKWINVDGFQTLTQRWPGLYQQWKILKTWATMVQKKTVMVVKLISCMWAQRMEMCQCHHLIYYVQYWHWRTNFKERFHSYIHLWYTILCPVRHYSILAPTPR